MPCSRQMCRTRRVCQHLQPSRIEFPPVRAARRWVTGPECDQDGHANMKEQKVTLWWSDMNGKLVHAGVQQRKSWCRYEQDPDPQCWSSGGSAHVCCIVKRHTTTVHQDICLHHTQYSRVKTLPGEHHREIPIQAQTTYGTESTMDDAT